MSKTLTSLVGIVLLYLLAVLLIYVLPVNAITSISVLNSTNFLLAFQGNALTVLGVSFGCILVWFLAGEWMIQPWAASRTWYLTWSLLAVVVIATAVYTAYQGPKGATSDPVNYGVAGWYFGLGFLSFYISSVCFSPTNAKYLIWPAETVRVW